MEKATAFMKLTLLHLQFKESVVWILGAVVCTASMLLFLLSVCFNPDTLHRTTMLIVVNFCADIYTSDTSGFFFSVAYTLVQVLSSVATFYPQELSNQLYVFFFFQ